MAIGDGYLTIIDQRTTGPVGAVPRLNVSIAIEIDGDTLRILEVSQAKFGAIYGHGVEGERFQSSMNQLSGYVSMTDGTTEALISAPSHVTSPPLTGFTKIQFGLEDWGLAPGWPIDFQTGITRLGHVYFEETT